MGLSPIKPRDGSREEKERYQRDVQDQIDNPRAWGLFQPPKPKDIPSPVSVVKEPPQPEPHTEVTAPTVEVAPIQQPVPEPPQPEPREKKRLGRPPKGRS